jgi:hypothetical protein
VELNIVDRASDSTIGRTLKKHSPVASETAMGHPAEANSAFVAAMEDVLAVYTRPDTRKRKSEPTGNTNFDLNRRASLRPYLRGAEGATPSVYSPVKVWI